MFYRLMPMNTTPYIIYILLLVALAGCAVLSMLCLRYKREADMLRENACPADDVPVAHDVTPLPEPMEISSADEEKNVLLLAEDDLVMRSYLEQALAAEYRLVSVSDGAEALAKAKEVNPDIIIADIMMTALKGDELCRTLKSSVDTSHIPVVLLTALGEREDIIYGLEAGADDYVVKPFSNSELLLRVKSLLRRVRQYGGTSSASPAEESLQEEVYGGTEKRRLLQYKDLILDLDAQSAVLDGQVVVLTYTEFKILELFLSHPGKIFSLENIYQSIWEEEAVGDGTIMVHIKNIRKKLKDSSRNPRYIKTAWGKGYYVD